MSVMPRDPLLSIAKAVLRILMFFMGLGIAGCVVGLIVGLPAAWWNYPELLREAPELGNVPVGIVLLIAVCLLACAIALLTFLLWIFRLLLAMVDTVKEGDPFVPENAARLTRMAWLSLAVQLISLPMSALGMWMAYMFRAMKDAHDVNVSIDTGLSGNGLLLVLTLFILARVFRKGTEMRADLEGTV